MTFEDEPKAHGKQGCAQHSNVAKQIAPLLKSNAARKLEQRGWGAPKDGRIQKALYSTWKIGGKTFKTIFMEKH